jgi:cobalt/nickel transport system permease protein
VSGAHHTSSPGNDTGPLEGALSRLAPEAKVVGLVAFLAVVAVTPPSRPWALAAQALVAASVAVFALTPPRAVLARLAIDAPLVVLAGVYAVAGHGPRTEVLGLQLSRPGLAVGLTVLAKATIGIVAVSALAASTNAVDTIVGLRRLRVPAWFCELLALVVRQLGLLRQDLQRLQLATGVRAGTAGWRNRWSVAGRSFGALFVRSAERLDRLQLALAARGGSAFASAMGTAGSIDARGRRGRRPAAPRDWAWAVLPALLAAAAATAGAWR